MDNATFITFFGPITSTAAELITSRLADEAFVHSITRNIRVDSPSEDPEVLIANNAKRYNSDYFYGIMIDISAVSISTVGHSQYEAYNNIHSTFVNTKNVIKIKFGIRTASSIGSATITTLIRAVEFHIVEADTPFLLCLKNINRLQVYLNNLKNVLITPKREISVVRQFGHLFLLWNKSF